MDILDPKEQAICHTRRAGKGSPSDRKDDIWSVRLRLLKDVYCSREYGEEQMVDDEMELHSDAPRE